MCHCVRMYGVYVWMDLVDGKPACVSRGICCGCAAGANTAAFSEVEVYILAVLPQMSPVTKMRPRHSLVSPRQLLVQAQLVRGGQLLLNSRLGTSWGCIHLQAQVSHKRNTLGDQKMAGDHCMCTADPSLSGAPFIATPNPAKHCGRLHWGDSQGAWAMHAVGSTRFGPSHKIQHLTPEHSMRVEWHHSTTSWERSDWQSTH